MSNPVLTSNLSSGPVAHAEGSDQRRFVERRYPDGTIDWLWVKYTKPGDIDCTDLSIDELSARIAEAKANGLKVV